MRPVQSRAALGDHRARRFCRAGTLKLCRSAALALPLFLSACSGTRPPDLGFHGGRLAPCPDSPNCVSSQSETPGQFIEPLRYAGSDDDARSALLAVLAATPRVRLVATNATYIHAEFTTALWRFVDDVEFAFDPTNAVIHVRSASRLGYSDLGANRKRVERLRHAFAAAVAPAP